MEVHGAERSLVGVPPPSPAVIHPPVNTTPQYYCRYLKRIYIFQHRNLSAWLRSLLPRSVPNTWGDLTKLREAAPYKKRGKRDGKSWMRLNRKAAPLLAADERRSPVCLLADSPRAVCRGCGLGRRYIMACACNMSR